MRQQQNKPDKSIWCLCQGVKVNRQTRKKHGQFFSLIKNYGMQLNGVTSFFYFLCVQCQTTFAQCVCIAAFTITVQIFQEYFNK